MSISLFLISANKNSKKRRSKTMEMILNNGFCEMSQDEMVTVDGGFVITIGALTITGAALAKGAALLGGAYMAGYTLGSHIKAAQGR